MKTLKKVLIIIAILLIQSFIVIYKIISKLWKKYNENLKQFIKRLDIELRRELQWQINLE